MIFFLLKINLIIINILYFFFFIYNFMSNKNVLNNLLNSLIKDKLNILEKRNSNENSQLNKLDGNMRSIKSIK